MATRANSILVEGSANLLSFHTTQQLIRKSALYIPGNMEPTFHYGVTSELDTKKKTHILDTHGEYFIRKKLN